MISITPLKIAMSFQSIPPPSTLADPNQPNPVCPIDASFTSLETCKRINDLRQRLVNYKALGSLVPSMKLTIDELGDIEEEIRGLKDVWDPATERGSALVDHQFELAASARSFIATLKATSHALKALENDWIKFSELHGQDAPRSDPHPHITIIATTRSRLEELKARISEGCLLFIEHLNRFTISDKASDGDHQRFLDALEKAWLTSKFGLLPSSIGDEIWDTLTKGDGELSLPPYFEHMRTLGAAWVKERLPDPEAPSDSSTSSLGTYNKFNEVANTLLSGMGGAIKCPAPSNPNSTSVVTARWTDFVTKGIPKVQERKKPLRIALFGIVSNGKSSFINALLGRSLLPHRGGSTTAWPLVIKHDPSCKEPCLTINEANINPWLRKLQSKKILCPRGPDVEDASDELTPELVADKTASTLPSKLLNTLRKFNEQVLAKDGCTLGPFSFETDYCGEATIWAQVDLINNLMHLCWKLLKEEEFPDIENMQWPVISIDMGDIGTNTAGGIEFVDLPGIFDNATGPKGMPEYLLKLAASTNIDGAIWIVRAYNAANQQISAACQKAIELFNDGFLGIYGTWAEDVDPNDANGIRDTLCKAAYGVTDPGMRVQFCSPGLFSSARHAVLATQPYFDDEKQKQAQDPNWWQKWKNYALGEEDPPNMPPLDLYLNDGFSETAINRLIPNPRAEPVAYQDYFNEGGLLMWMMQLRRLEKAWDFNATRKHLVENVAYDGNYRLRLYQIWVMQQTLSTLVSSQRYAVVRLNTVADSINSAFVQSAKEKLDQAKEGYADFTRRALQTVLEWNEEVDELKKSIEGGITDSLNQAMDKTDTIVEDTIREVAMSQEFKDKYNARSEEISLANLEERCLLLERINEALTPRLAEEQRILHDQTFKAVQDIWIYRLKRLMEKFRPSEEDLEPHRKKAIVEALSQCFDIRKSVYSLIIKNLKDLPGSSTDVTQRFEEALSKPWLAAQEARAAILPNRKASTLTDVEFTVVERLNKVGFTLRPALSGTLNFFTQTLTKSKWDFMRGRRSAEVQLSSIINIHRQVVASSWKEVIETETRNTLLGSIDTAGEIGEGVVSQMLAAWNKKHLDTAQETRRKVKPELVRGRIVNHAILAAALGAADTLCAIGRNRLGPGVLPEDKVIASFLSRKEFYYHVTDITECAEF
ncbi:hypothetical protein FRC17_000722 [Serendipita sp. 399]|nr:hypothetical protein FRC17_000722 [Serendipita sp. 399]